MKLSNLRPAQGATHSEKRLARGIGSGTGRTAGRGTKGAGSRSGNKNKRAHEGGQIPLQMRLPKGGFKNVHRRYKTYVPGEYQPVNLDTIAELTKEHGLQLIDAATLVKHGILHKGEKFKVLSRGTIEQGVEVIADRFSDSARKAIAAAGGKAYTSVKLNQLQGIAHHRNFKRLELKVIYESLQFLKEGDLICVVPEGDLSMTFDVTAHKITPEAQAQLEAQGGKVNLV